MSKKIVVITGSPRKDGNSFAMTDAFIRAAQAKGHTVTRFDAAMMKIGGCHACETCFKTGKACSFDDDFNLIAPAVLEADALVFTMPCTGTPSPPRSRGSSTASTPWWWGGKDIAGKECALIACCEEEDRVRAGWRSHSHGAHGRPEQVEDGGRGADTRRSERGRHPQDGRLCSGSGAGRQDLTRRPQRPAAGQRAENHGCRRRQETRSPGRPCHSPQPLRKEGILHERNHVAQGFPAYFPQPGDRGVHPEAGWLHQPGHGVLVDLSLV